MEIIPLGLPLCPHTDLDGVLSGRVGTIPTRLSYLNSNSENLALGGRLEVGREHSKKNSRLWFQVWGTMTQVMTQVPAAVLTFGFQPQYWDPGQGDYSKFRTRGTGGPGSSKSVAQVGTFTFHAFFMDSQVCPEAKETRQHTAHTGTQQL